METVFSNDMVAHVWAQQKQHYGRSNNGNFYFEGPALYSYGTHYMVGLFAPDGTVFLNSTSSTPTTEGKHKNAARRALPGYGRDAARVPELEDIAPLIREANKRGLMPADSAQAVTQYLKKHWQSLPADSAGAAWLLRAIRSRATWAAMRGKLEREATRKADDSARRLIAAARRDGARFAARTIADVRGDAWADMARGRHIGADTAKEYRESRLATPKGHKNRRAALYAREKAYRAVMARAVAIRETLPYGRAQARINGHAALYRLRRFLTGSGLGHVPGYDGPDGPDKRDAALALANGAGWRVLSDTLQSLVRNASMPARLRQAAVALQAYAHERAAELEGEHAKRREIRESHSRVLRNLRTFNAARRNWQAFKDSGRADESINALSASRMLAEISNAIPPARPYGTDTGFAHAPRLAERAERIARRATEIAASYADDRARYLDAWERADAERRERQAARKLELAAMGRDKLTAEYRAGRLTDYEAQDAGGPVMLKAVNPEIDGCRVTGGNLVTSQGATVPLAHAFKVFQFVAYCRREGKAWRPADSRDAMRAAFRHGPSRIRVGHFSVDSIDSTGDFVAGCHAIKWPDVEALAQYLGVADCVIQSPAEIGAEC